MTLLELLEKNNINKADLSESNKISLFEDYLLNPELEVLNKLVSIGFDINDCDCLLIKRSAEMELMTTLALCLSQPNEMTDRGYAELLKELVLAKKNEVIICLIENGVNPRLDNNILISTSARLNNNVLVKYLIEKTNVIVTARSNSVIKSLGRNGDQEMLEFFLQYVEKNLGAGEVATIFWELFIAACEINDVNLIKLCINKDSFKVNKVSINGLKKIILNNNAEVLDFTLSEVLNDKIELSGKVTLLERVNDILSTLIKESCSKGAIDCYLLLKDKYNAYPYARNSGDFRNAIKYNRIEMAKLLLEDDNYNFASAKNFALRQCIMKENIEMMNLLLEKKCVLDGLGEKFFSKLSEKSKDFFRGYKNIKDF